MRKREFFRTAFSVSCLVFIDSLAYINTDSWTWRDLAGSAAKCALIFLVGYNEAVNDARIKERDKHRERKP
jgi:hypothetical protein